MIESEKSKLVKLVVEDIYESYPWLTERFGQNGIERTIEDNYHHLNHLETAYEMGQESFFIDYSKWLESILTSRGVGTDLIVDNYKKILYWMDHVEFDSEKEKKSYQVYLNAGINALNVSS